LFSIVVDRLFTSCLWCGFNFRRSWLFFFIVYIIIFSYFPIFRRLNSYLSIVVVLISIIWSILCNNFLFFCRFSSICNLSSCCSLSRWNHSFSSSCISPFCIWKYWLDSFICRVSEHINSIRLALIIDIAIILLWLKIIIIISSAIIIIIISPFILTPCHKGLLLLLTSMWLLFSSTLFTIIEHCSLAIYNITESFNAISFTHLWLLLLLLLIFFR